VTLGLAGLAVVRVAPRSFSATPAWLRSRRNSAHRKERNRPAGTCRRDELPGPTLQVSRWEPLAFVMARKSVSLSFAPFVLPVGFPACWAKTRLNRRMHPLTKVSKHSRPRWASSNEGQKLLWQAAWRKAMKQTSTPSRATRLQDQRQRTKDYRSNWGCCTAEI